MISIIVPVYNAEKVLSRCVESILKQSYTDFELILIDDGSTDNSNKICDEYAEKDKRIKVHHIENGGVSKARNLGIKSSLGEYIMFCDSDDVVLSNWCKTLFDTITEHKSAWVSCGVNVKDQNGNISRIIKLNDNDSENEKVSVLSVSDYGRIYKTGTSGYIWNKIYDASVIRSNNILFDETTDYAEDTLFNNEYIKHCDEICFVNIPLYDYYAVMGENNLSNKYYKDYYDKVKPIYESRKALMSDEYMADFCYDYFYYFNESLQGTFDKRNKVSLIKKLKYNNYIINDESFKDCINRMKKLESDKKYVSMLLQGNYFKIYLLDKIRSLKNIIKK